MLSASKSGSGLSTGYNFTRSLRFRTSSTANMYRSNVSPTNNKIWTWSAWVKRGAIGSTSFLFTGGQGAGTNYGELYFESNSTLNFFDNVSGSNIVTTQVFRDPSAWYHIVLAIDTTQATASNRVKIYVNGVQVTAFSTATYPAQNNTFALNASGYYYTMGMVIYNGAFILQSSDFYIAENYFVDGQQLTPSSFGSTNATTGVWQPAKYAGTYGANGAYYAFTTLTSTTTLGNDSSGNGNNFSAVNGFSLTAGVTYDSMTDVPTLTSATAANFAVLNPLFKSTNQSSPSNGNLTITGNGGGNFYGGLISSIFAPASSGKFYWEFKAITLFTTNGYFAGGIATNNYTPTNNGAGTYNPGGTIAGAGTGMNFYPNNTGVELSLNGSTSSLSASYAVGDVMNFALDTATGNFWIGKNNTWLTGNPSTNTTPTGTITGATAYAPWFGCYTSSDTWSGTFGQQPFSYTPPTGFVALNTYNLPTSTILAGNKVMDATLWTGNGSTQTITNAGGFKPDLVWAKARSSGSWWHILVDSVRGVGRTLSSNVTNAELGSGSDCIPAINSNGFNVNVSPNASVNENGTTYVGWQWQAGQGTTSNNTSGSITSTVSVNASAGFSVVTYTGNGSSSATVGHGLGVVPAMVITKGRSSATEWMVKHQSLPTGQNLLLNQTLDAPSSLSFSQGVIANLTSSSTFGFTSGSSGVNNANQSGVTYVAYCWTPIAGYSAFGSYTGNGSADGTFVYTGFTPRWVMVKRTDSTGDWQILDTARGTYNPDDARLWADLSSAEVSNGNGNTDFLSNGFKFRNTNADNNASGGTYIYAAFATNPFRNSLAR